MSTALSVPLALSVPRALSVPEMYYDKIGFILKGFTYVYDTKYRRVKFGQGPSSGSSDGSVSLDSSGIYSSTTGPISQVTVSVKNFSFTGMTGKTPCVYLSWCDKSGTVYGQPIPLVATAVSGSASVSASVSVPNPNGYSYFLLTFNENAAQGATTPESFATPLNVTIESMTVLIN